MTIALPFVARRSTRRPWLAWLAAGVVAASGCLDDSPVGAGSPDVRATFSANVVGAAAGGTVRIRIGYRTQAEQLVFLPSSPEQVSVSPGSTVVLPLTVDISRCLADDSRLPRGEPGCTLVIELTLSDPSGNVIDSQTREAEQPATPGQSVNFGTVTIGTTVASIDVTPPSVTLDVGQEQRLTATAHDASGAVVPSATIVWTITDATVAQFSATTGPTVTIRGLKLGTATVTASAGGTSSNGVAVTVAPPTPLTIRQRPGAGCVIVGQTVTLDVESPPGPVTWSISDASIATIGSTNGVVTGVAAGQATVTATSGNRAGTATVCVTGPLRVSASTTSIVAGSSTQLAVTGASGGTVSFASSAPQVATVDASGVVRGLTIGQATITTTLTAASGTESVPIAMTVIAAGIVITPNTASVPIGRSVRLTASVQDANGAPMEGVPVTWSITNGAIGRLSATAGTVVDVVALAVGNTTVTATAGGATGTAQFTGTQPLPAARLEKVSGDDGTCPTYSSDCTFVVRAVDANGFAVAGATVIWSSPTPICGPPRFATTDNDGLATATNLCSAVEPGTYTQTVTLSTTQHQVAFSYRLRGLVLTFNGLDSFERPTFLVTSDTPASGLSVRVEYGAGPVDNYVTDLGLDRTTTPAILTYDFRAFELPFGQYTFDVIVSTTTPGIGPGVITESFFNDPNSFRPRGVLPQRTTTPATPRVRRRVP